MMLPSLSQSNFLAYQFCILLQYSTVQIVCHLSPYDILYYLFRENLQASFIFNQLTKLQRSSEQYAAEHYIQFHIINPLKTKRRLV
jgi:hypothetical protein